VSGSIPGARGSFYVLIESKMEVKVLNVSGKGNRL
jgi:hypothetical protein